MAGYIGSKAVLLSTTAAVVTGDADIGGGLTVDTNTLFVDAANNRVGVGTSSPVEKLDVGGNIRVGVGFTIGRVDFGTGTINGGTNFGDLRIHTDRFRVYNAAGTQIAYNVDSAGAPTWYINGSERARIDASGSLLVGTTTSAGAGAVGLTGQFRAGYQGVLNGFGAEDVSGLFYSGGSSSGFVAVNSNSGNACLYLALTASATTGNLISFSDTGTGVGTISTNGSSTSYNTSSDYRLKENVTALAGAADRLAQIPVHRFNFIADPDTTVDGFLAHEVQAFVPEAVTGEKDAVETVEIKDEDGNVIGTEERPVYQGIDQSKLVPLLTAALQEALTKIDALEARIVTLEGGAA